MMATATTPPSRLSSLEPAAFFPNPSLTSRASSPQPKAILSVPELCGSLSYYPEICSIIISFWNGEPRFNFEMDGLVDKMKFSIDAGPVHWKNKDLYTLWRKGVLESFRDITAFGAQDPVGDGLVVLRAFTEGLEHLNRHWIGTPDHFCLCDSQMEDGSEDGSKESLDARAIKQILVPFLDTRVTHQQRAAIDLRRRYCSLGRKAICLGHGQPTVTWITEVLCRLSVYGLGSGTGGPEPFWDLPWDDGALPKLRNGTIGFRAARDGADFLEAEDMICLERGHGFSCLT